VLLAVGFTVNGIYQVARKPAELFFPVSGALDKTPAQTWRQYGPIFRAHSTGVITPDFLASKTGNSIFRKKLLKAFAMQLVEDREGTATGAHFLHRRLVELAPLDRELHGVDVADALLLEEQLRLAGYAGTPINRGAEHVEYACADVHETSSRFTIAWIPLLPSTSCVTRKSTPRLQSM